MRQPSSPLFITGGPVGVPAPAVSRIEAVEQADVQLIADYAELWLANRTRNQPVRLDGATLQAEIGYDWFSQARDPWGAIH
jgi:Holliday junction resolvase-like predicted endonuclease